jgi:hypothetical protein
MQSPHQKDSREEGLNGIAVTAEEAVAIREHLLEILSSPVFRGSPRCSQFLKHVVDEAIAGRYDTLKERVIGIELFGRPPSYDTGEDAIVRVTASDVRRRLLQHYGGLKHAVRYRITLPPGSYVPHIIHEDGPPAVDEHGRVLHAEISSPNEAANDVEPGPLLEEPNRKHRRLVQWVVFGLLLIAFNAAWAVVFWLHARQIRPESASVLPWSTLFSSTRATKLITSDPNIAEIQGFTGGQISLSDYANHKYIPDPHALTPEQLRFCTVILRGDKAAVVDTLIAAMVAQFAQANGRKITIQGARDSHLSDLQTDDNLVLLGSPRSNPWVGFFNDHLDFRYEYDKSIGKEVIRNTHPRKGERAVYTETAPGWATGESYAIIAFIQNPDEHGQVLLLSGENGEGTEATGRLVSDLPRLTATLKQCGIASAGAPKHFEMLLHLNTLAGLPNNIDVVGCHIL